MFLVSFDDHLIHALRRIAFPLARFALFLVFFWFGALKVVGTSPANPLVEGLLERTLPFISFDTFIVLFGIFEMVIGVLFLIPRLERPAIFLFVVHMITTFMPMVLLPQVAWEGFLIPTIEGQYMIKNIALVALAVGIAAHLDPLPAKRN